MGSHLGNLEEMVLLVVAMMHEEARHENAYGVSITDEYNKQANSDISLSAVHTVLRRLEKKGFIESYMGGATQDRGGRRKRLYKITRYGYNTLQEMQENRQRIWQQIPKISFG
ncbi:PadR family transcriptional regulator [Chondrinema litorale]|uniref:PadR family transcriptional regulator n=1 Tax=Chondrinema litorale TaxID=2994555 RepID=UPI002542C7A1|nr:PadR family transcriptional regulator [Chondrinema litorale]UZR98676.1 PadR family transcriptional regulator [Chondrinema litorale]